MNKTTIILLILILILGAFFRFYRISEVPLGLYPDEAMNGNNALETITTGDFKIFYPENNGREGLFINIQAISIRLFGNEPWALRVVSAVFGTLTILGIYLLTIELLFKNFQLSIINYQSNPDESISKRLKIGKLRNLLEIGNWKLENYEVVALLAAFFTATSFWHINFSRIGFRAIMVPFLAVFGAYFLLKGLRTGKISSLVFAGIFTGLGLHTYIAFRFVPFVLVIPIIWYLLKWRESRKNQESRVKNQDNDHDSLFMLRASKSCTPCAVALFIFAAFVAALPIGYYFLQNPQDFFGRGGQVSVFAADSPIYEFAKSNLLTAQMFFFKGDCNWRHNYNCTPELHPLAGIFFIIGLFSILTALVKKPVPVTDAFETYISNKLMPALILAWLFFMSLPATLTREGIPHALRTIGMIPPVMMLAGLGAYRLYTAIVHWLGKHKLKFPEISGKITRIQSEIAIVGILALLWIPTITYRNYFIYWANHKETYFSFASDMQHLGKYLDSLPGDTTKYVVVNMSGVEVRGIPMPSQTVMFTTNTFTEAGRRAKNLRYILPEDIKNIILPENKKVIIAPLYGNDAGTRHKINEFFPEFSEKAPGDFIIYSSPEN